MSYFGQDPYGYVYVQHGYYPPYSTQYSFPPPNNLYRERRKPKTPKDNAQLWCDICGVGCIGQQSYAEHCNGKKHQALARKAQSTGSASTDHSTTPSPPTVQQSSVRYAPYEGGSTALIAEDSKNTQGKYHCDICNVYSTDKNTFNLHLSGKKHKTTVLRVGSPQLTRPVPQRPLVGDRPTTPNNSNYINMPRFHIPAAPKSSFSPLLISHPSNLAEDNLLNSNIASLSPSAEDLRPLSALVQAVTSKLEEYKPQPEGADELVDGMRGKPAILDMKMVGPYASGTLVKGSLCADMVLITKDPPELPMLHEYEKAIKSALPHVVTALNEEKMDLIIKAPGNVSMHLMFTWAGAEDIDSPRDARPQSPPASEDITGVNVPACQRALMMVHQTHFFSDNSLSPNLRPCVKILKDLQTRMPVFAPLTSWAIEVIIINALRTVPLSASFSQSLRAVFAFMASGMLLPGVELIDPCSPDDDSVLSNLTNQERLDITEAAQKILNDMSFGKLEEILGA